MQAIILAAGRGSRLGRKGNERPKCLQEIGRRPLVDYQLEALAEAGIAPVVMVVGYCADEIREVVGVRAEYIENPRWSTTNSLYSFWLARNWVDGPVVVLNSDTVFHPEVLERLLDAEGDAFAYDSESGDGREHMKVKLSGGRLVAMSKKLPVEEASGENVGILKFTKETASALFETAGELLEKGHSHSWLGSAVGKIARTHRLEAVDVAGLPWAEIDCCYDLAKARKVVLPAIRRRDRRRRTPWRMARTAAPASLLAFPTYFALHLWMAPGERTWESTELTGVESTTISKDAVEQRWWMLDEVDEARALVAGPGTVRIDSRWIEGDPSSSELPYVLEIKQDGRRLGWFNYSEAASGSWKHAGGTVGSKASLDIDLGEGVHTLAIRLIAADSGHSLVRLRRQSSEDEESPE